jgi:hypothetical protein
MRLLHGQAGRYPERRLEPILRQQGFLPTQHFLDRLRERAQAQGIRFEPRTFASEFQRAAHYRQTRPGYSTRIAVMRGLPLLYRMGGERGNRVALVGVLPSGGLPPVAPARAPRLGESEQMLSGRRPDTLVDGRGRGTGYSSVPNVGTPATMDFSSHARADYPVRLENALATYPELRGAFRDIFIERMGITTKPQAGFGTTGVTPAGIQAARDMLRSGGTLRILQGPRAGQSWQNMGRVIRRMLARQGFTNIRARRHVEAGNDLVLVTATRP